MPRVHSEADATTWLAQQSCRCGQRSFGRDPVLVDQAGELLLQFAGCASCGQPRYLHARLPEHLELAVARIPGAHRILEPELVSLLKPWIEAAFPRFAPPREASPDTSFAFLGPDWKVVEWLRGSLGYGQARCVRRDGAAALATFSGPQTQSLDRVLSKLTLTARGVAPILDLRDARDCVVLFEAEPPGVTLATAMFPLNVDAAALLLGRLLEIVADAHARGEVLRGVRPETIYIDRELVVGVAPRGELFAGGAKQSRDLNPQYPFPAIYQAPDMLSGTPTSASDVFSCCAVLLFALTRRPPYDAPSAAWQLAAMMNGPPPLPPGLDPRLAELVRAGLDPVPSRRPSALELARALAAS